MLASRCKVHEQDEYCYYRQARMVEIVYKWWWCLIDKCFSSFWYWLCVCLWYDVSISMLVLCAKMHMAIPTDETKNTKIIDSVEFFVIYFFCFLMVEVICQWNLWWGDIVPWEFPNPLKNPDRRSFFTQCASSLAVACWISLSSTFFWEWGKWWSTPQKIISNNVLWGAEQEYWTLKEGFTELQDRLNQTLIHDYCQRGEAEKNTEVTPQTDQYREPRKFLWWKKSFAYGNYQEYDESEDLLPDIPSNKFWDTMSTFSESIHQFNGIPWYIMENGKNKQDLQSYLNLIGFDFDAISILLNTIDFTDASDSKFQKLVDAISWPKWFKANVDNLLKYIERYPTPLWLQQRPQDTEINHLTLRSVVPTVIQMPVEIYLDTTITQANAEVLLGQVNDNLALPINLLSSPDYNETFQFQYIPTYVNAPITVPPWSSASYAMAFFLYNTGVDPFSFPPVCFISNNISWSNLGVSSWHFQAPCDNNWTFCIKGNATNNVGLYCHETYNYGTPHRKNPTWELGHVGTNYVHISAALPWNDSHPDAIAYWFAHLVDEWCRETTPLPVELTSFLASCDGIGGVTIDFETETEANNNGFQIKISTDWSTWTPIGNFIDWAWTTQSSQQYHQHISPELINSVTKGQADWQTLYFRLEQHDLNWSTTQSHVISTSCGVDDKPVVSVSPNPSNWWYLNIHAPESLWAYIYSISSSDWKKSFWPVDAQWGVTYLFPTSTLSPWVYVLQIKDSQWRTLPGSIKFVVSSTR